MMLNSLFFIVAGWSLCIDGGVSAGRPGKLLPRLEAYPAKSHRSLPRPRTLTQLEPLVAALPPGPLSSVPFAHRRATNPLINKRTATCQTTGYTVCASETFCCPAEGSCCASGNCCDNRYMCCASGDCCPDGYTCDTVDGVAGCCPSGQTCSTTTTTCADASYVACANADFCCPAGETCSTTNGQPSCGGSTSASASAVLGGTTLTGGASSAIQTASITNAASTSTSNITTTSIIASNTSSTSAFVSTSVVVVAASISSTTISNSTSTTSTNMIPTTMTNAIIPATNIPLTAEDITASLPGPSTATLLNPTGAPSGALAVVGLDTRLLVGASSAIIAMQLLISVL